MSFNYTPNRDGAINARSGVGFGRISTSGIYDISIKRIRYMKAKDPSSKSSWLSFSANVKGSGEACFFNIWLTNKSGERDDRAGQFDSLLMALKINSVTTKTITDNARSFDVIAEFEGKEYEIRAGIQCTHWVDSNGETGIDHDISHFFLPDNRTISEALRGVQPADAKEYLTPMVDRHITKTARSGGGAKVDNVFGSGSNANTGFSFGSSSENDLPF